MLVTDNEYADPAVQEINVTAAPEEIWLVYGDLERDTTHAECYRDGDVNWCEDSQFSSDVRYVRADIADAAVAAALERRSEYDDALMAAERERWLKAATAALELLDDLPVWSNAAHACKLLRDALGPNVGANRIDPVRRGNSG